MKGIFFVTLLSALLAICTMAGLYAAHGMRDQRPAFWAFRSLVSLGFAASVALHLVRSDTWIGASVFYVCLGMLTIHFFHATSRQWMGTGLLSLLSASLVALLGWLMYTLGLWPLQTVVNMSLTVLSLLLGGALIYATLLIPSRHSLFRMVAVMMCAVLADIVVFAAFGRVELIDRDLRLIMLTIGVLVGSWYLDLGSFSKIGTASQRRAFDSLLGTLETLAATTDIRLSNDQMLSLSTFTDTTTEAAEARVGSSESWKRLLDAAVILVPGAEGGSIRIRDGDGDFTYVAQHGFSNSLLGLRVSAQQASNWHGDLLEWHSGRARTAKRPFDTREPLDANPQFYSTETKRIRANLYFPIVVDGEVMAEINLDSFSSDSAFSDESVVAAKQFAVQIAALVKAQRERAKLAARLREFEMLELITSALHDAHTPETVAASVVSETVRLMNAPNVAMLLMNTPLTSLRLSSGLGLFANHVGVELPWGHGLSWSAIQARETLESRDVDNDPRAVQLTASTSSTPLEQLTVPLLDSSGGALGTLLVSRELQLGFTQLEKRLIEVIGRVAAGTLERVQVTRDLQLQVEESQSLLSLAQLLEDNDEQSLLTALERVRMLGKADAAVITDASNGFVTTRVYCGAFTEALRQGLEVGMSLAKAASLTMDRRSFQVTTERPPELRSLLKQLGITAAFAVVLDNFNSVVLYRFTGGGWSAAERQMLEASARMLGALVSRLGRLKTLENGYASALKTIGLALEMRDLETANHTERVALLSEAVGEQLGLAAAERLALRWGAYLHDIGKFGVPDAILQKPARLSEAEMVLVREHPRLGFDLVRDLPFLPSAARDIVLYHHERWDGGGYPTGLAGDAIPLPARIFAVCDVFDALRSKRIYKDALSLDASLLELHREVERGHLELRLVTALEEVIQRSPQRLELPLYPI